MGNTMQTVEKKSRKEEEDSIKNIIFNWLPAKNCFIKREDILEKIKEEFSNNKCVVLHGLPGIGKRETARQFGTYYCDSFNRNLIWIFSETSDNIEKCFEKLATSLDVETTDICLIFNKFKKSKALFVYENAESMEAIQDYLPCNETYPTVHVLITSRLSNWVLSTSISKIPLNVLNMEDALSIFKHKLGYKFEEYKLKNWKKLVQNLNGIPICLQLVSSLIQQEVNRILLTEFNLEDFINELEKNLISSTISDSEPDYYQKSVHAGINFVLSRFEEANATSSLDLLCFVAYLNADLVDYDILLLIPSIEKSEHQLEEALKKLVDYSLIQIVKEPYSSMRIKGHRTIQLVLRNYDLTKRNGDMFKSLLKLSLMSYKMYSHETSIFKYANKKEFLEKTTEFYNENLENVSLIEEYVHKLVEYNCDEALQIILPELKNDSTERFIKVLFYAFTRGSDVKIIQFFLEIIAQNEENVRQIKALAEWRTTKLINLLLDSNIFKNRENVSEDNIILKNMVTGKFLHSLVAKSNKENVRETLECIDHLISKWGADILCQDDDSKNNILHEAFVNEEISLEIIKYLFQLENGKLKSIVDCQNEFKETPLHALFCWYENNPDVFEIFRYLICDCKADITIQDEAGRNILFYICRYGSFEMIEFILKERDCSQFIFDQDKDGDVALSLLIENSLIKEMDRMKLIDYFFKNKKEIHKSENYNEIINKMLYEEVSQISNNLEIIKLLIKNGAKLEETDDIPCGPSMEFFDTLLPAIIANDKISVGNRFLHSLVSNSNKENVDEIIKCINHLISRWDADILHQDNNLNNLIHIACQNSNISSEIIEYLFQLENGKLKRIVDCQNMAKETPLHYLLYYIDNNNPDLFKIFRYFICECKADITIQNNNGRNILFYVCWYKSFEMIEIILKERDCSRFINDQDEDGDVAFTLLIWNDSIEEADKIELFNLFLKNGMDINLKNEKNKTVLDFAEEEGLITLTKVIKNHLKEPSILNVWWGVVARSLRTDQ